MLLPYYESPEERAGLARLEYAGGRFALSLPRRGKPGTPEPPIGLESVDLAELWHTLRQSQDWTIDRERSGIVALIPHITGPTLFLAANQCHDLPTEFAEGAPAFLDAYCAQRSKPRRKATHPAHYWSS